MFPLDTDQIPTTAAEWRDVLAATLTRWVAGPVRLAVEGDPPTLANVDVDLSGGRLGDGPPPDGTAVGPSTPGPTVARLHAVARPLIVRRVPVSFDVTAAQARFALGRNGAGRVVVLLTDATDGRAWVHLAVADLESALLQAGRAAAAPHGVDIQSIQANLTARGPRDLDVILDVTAKKFMTFTVRVTGHLSVDDSMTATATNLHVAGTGMAASFAAGIVRAQLQKLEGQRLPLTSFNLGDVRLRDVSVDVTDGLRLTATFGGAA